MSTQKEPSPLEVEQRIKAQSLYFAGVMGSRFFTTLRDEQIILGVHCPTCQKVFWPPRSTCGRCFGQLDEHDLREIGPHGTLETFTQVFYQEPIHPRPGPLIYGIISLDRADTGMTHLIGGVAFAQLRAGMRMKPVFAPRRNADILDISHFTPV